MADFRHGPCFPARACDRQHCAGAGEAAISLSLVGRDAIAQRLGRNASFASIGSGLAATGMGACGYYLSSRAVFFVAAAMVAPALIALYRIRAHEINPARAHGGCNKHNLGASASGLHPLFANRPLRLFAGCAFLFHLANAAMLPLAASMLTLRSSQSATILVATSIVVPKFIVAALSPGVGRKAQQWGRRPLLVVAFGALSIRGVLFALVVNPELLVAVQFLDAISAAVLGVLVPLTVADVSRGTGHFNLAQGVIGCAVGIGAAVSTAIVGYLNDQFGSQTAFVTLACIAAFGFVFVWMVMPELGRAEIAIERSAIRAKRFSPVAKLSQSIASSGSTTNFSFPPFDCSEDAFGVGGPDEGFGIGVGFFDEPVDCSPKVGNREPTPVGGRGRMRQIRDSGEDQPHGSRETSDFAQDEPFRNAAHCRIKPGPV